MGSFKCHVGISTLYIHTVVNTEISTGIHQVPENVICISKTYKNLRWLKSNE